MLTTPRDEEVMTVEKVCEACGVTYIAQRARSKFCGTRCRTRAHRGQITPAGAAAKTGAVVELPRRDSTPKTAKPATPAAPAAEERSALEQATYAELEASGKLETSLGQAALVLARRIASPIETGASVASLSRQLRETMTELGGPRAAEDPLDQLRARRDAKRNAG